MNLAEALEKLRNMIRKAEKPLKIELSAEKLEKLRMKYGKNLLSTLRYSQIFSLLEKKKASETDFSSNEGDQTRNLDEQLPMSIYEPNSCTNI